MATWLDEYHSEKAGRIQEAELPPPLSKGGSCAAEVWWLWVQSSCWDKSAEWYDVRSCGRWTGTCGRTQFPNEPCVLWHLESAYLWTSQGLKSCEIIGFESNFHRILQQTKSPPMETHTSLLGSFEAGRVFFPSVFDVPFPEEKNNWTKFCGGAKGFSNELLGQWAISHDQKLGSSISMERQSPPKWFAIAISYMTS